MELQLQFCIFCILEWGEKSSKLIFCWDMENFVNKAANFQANKLITPLRRRGVEIQHDAWYISSKLSHSSWLHLVGRPTLSTCLSISRTHLLPHQPGNTSNPIQCTSNSYLIFTGSIYVQSHYIGSGCMFMLNLSCITPGVLHDPNKTELHMYKGSLIGDLWHYAFHKAVPWLWKECKSTLEKLWRRQLLKTGYGAKAHLMIRRSLSCRFLDHWVLSTVLPAHDKRKYGTIIKKY